MKYAKIHIYENKFTNINLVNPTFLGGGREGGREGGGREKGELMSASSPPKKTLNN